MLITYRAAAGDTELMNIPIEIPRRSALSILGDLGAHLALSALRPCDGPAARGTTGDLDRRSESRRPALTKLHRRRRQPRRSQAGMLRAYIT